MRNLKDAFKPMPERFSYGIKDTIKETKFMSRKKHCIRVIKIVVVALILLTMIPTAVYGASQLYSFALSRLGNYGVSIEPTSSIESPEFVKLVVDVEGFSVVQNTNGLKYRKTDSTDKSDFSFLLTRHENGEKELYKNVAEYKVITINNHEAVILSGAGNAKATRVSMFFEDVNILATCYVNADITESEIISMLEGVDVIKGTQNDHTSYLVNEHSDYYCVSDTTKYELTRKGEILNIYPDVTACVNNICVIEDVSELNTEDFYFWGYDISNYVDASGNLISRRSDVWSLGDGINSTDTFVGSQEYEQKFVMADVTYTNYGSNSITFSVDLGLKVLEEDTEGNLKLSDIYVGDKNADDGLAQYIENSNKDTKGYYTYTLKPNETRTFRVGYRCDENQLENAYLVNKMYSGNCKEEYAIKVQNNG